MKTEIKNCYKYTELKINKMNSKTNMLATLYVRK